MITAARAGWYTGMKLGTEFEYGWLDAFHPDDRAAHLAKWRAATETGELFESEARIRGGDGEYRWFLTQGVPLRDESGEIVRWYGTNVDIDERKRAEEALREQANLLNLTHDSVFVRDRNNVITYWNHGAEERYGWTNEEAVGQVSHQLMHTQFPAPLNEIEAELTRTGRWEGELVHTKKDGAELVVASRWSLQRDKAGNYLGVLETNNDVTERKRGEALFAGEKRLLEMIATGVPLDEILNVICQIIEEYRSGTLASVLLLNADGLHLDSVAGPSLPDGWIEQMEKLPIGPCAGSCGTAAFRGSTVIVSDIATDPLWEVPEHRAAALNHGLRASWSNPVLSSRGKVLGTFCIYSREARSPNAQDLGVMEKATHLVRVAIERDRAEAALRTSEEKYRDLINASPDAICVIDDDGKFLLVNPAAVKLAGLAEAKLIGSSIAETYLPEERHLPAQRIKELRAAGSLRFERKLVRRNGEVISVEVLLSALRGRHYQAIIRDISQRKRREALLAGENRVLEMLAKGNSLAEILDSLCLLVEEQSSNVLASILLMDANGKQLRHGGAPHLPKAYTEAIDGTYIGPSVGSCGTAAYRGEQVIVSDIESDPRWAAFRDLALAHSLRACWSTPIFSSEGKVIGTFAMYYREQRSPSTLEQDTIKHVTHLAGIAIQRKLAETALRASEQVARGQVEALAQSLDVLTTAPDPEKFIGQMLNTIGRLLNAQSVTLWLLDQSTDSFVWRLMSDGGKLTSPDPQHPFVQDPAFWRQNTAIKELLFTAGPVVCEDVETDPRVNGEWREYLKRKETKRFLAVPLLMGGDVRGFIGVRHADRASYRPEQIELTQALAHQVMLALQLNEFAEQGQRAAVFEERNRMARDIHDTLAQGFTGVIVQLEAAEDAIVLGTRKDADKHLHRAGQLARQSLTEARRSVHALRPQALQEHNFWEALKGTIKSTTAGTALHATFEAQGKLPKLPEPWQANLLHIGQEALTNTLKYAHARNFKTRVTYKAKQLCLELRDDGTGFKAKDRYDGMGLNGMRERAEQMGGELEITTSRGKGTKITVLVPVNGEAS